MYSSANTMLNIVLSLLGYVSGNLHQQVASYIDPNTMQHVFTLTSELARHPFALCNERQNITFGNIVHINLSKSS